LAPAQKSKIRRLVQSREPEAGAAGELNVTPYLDIMMNILMFVLASVSVAFVSNVDVSPPSARPVHADVSQPLQLAVLVTERGIALKTGGSNVATGCDALGEGLAIPRRGATQDLEALTACVRKLKQARPEYSSEEQVTLTASPGIDYSSVVEVMDALRSDERGPLFPRVAFGLVR
jgi:biopolymer transport protein ExbD